MESTVSITSRMNQQVVTICVQGRYGYGSSGNQDASKIREAIDVAIKVAPIAALVIDLSEMHYEFGDAIGVLFHRYRDLQPSFRLSAADANAWNGLLTMIMPDWVSQLGNRIVFV
jgi:hypothetical protein